MSRILLTILCMWLPLQLMAQGFTVRGRVVDKLSRQPVAYANVSLYGNPGQGASTDSLGQFRIEHVAPGIHQLSVSCIGYKNLLSPEYIVSAKLPPVELELEEEASQLAEVTVQAAAPLRRIKERPVSLQIIGLSEIETSPGGNSEISRIVRS